MEKDRLMVDISMCRNDKCNKRNKCYRYMAIPSDKWQAYSEYTVRLSGEPADRDCFIQVEAGHRIRKDGK